MESYCHLIQGGLTVSMINDQGKIGFQPCCMMSHGSTIKIDLDAINKNIFKHPDLLGMREQNRSGFWNEFCSSCKIAEHRGEKSLRQNTSILYDGLSPDDILSQNGPLDLVITLDNGCNLACQTCGPNSSTTWESFLEKNGEHVIKKHFNFRESLVKEVFDPMDLSKLQSIKMFGGEPFLGRSTIKFLEYILQRRPDGDMVLHLQTNGTLPITREMNDALARFKLVKINISIDGIGKRFEYMRWPASWDNLNKSVNRLKQYVPVNVIFLIEQTLSIFNLWYMDEVKEWICKEFHENRLGDPVGYSNHTAWGDFRLDMKTREYNKALLTNDSLKIYHDPNFSENEIDIIKMIKLIEKYDRMRGHDWKQVFPEVASFYQRYL